jgi:hypothetical protein
MRNKALAAMVRVSGRFYVFLLPLYPATLRSGFRSDMLDVFRQQIRSESERHGFAGLLRVWSCVASEVIPDAVPREFLWTRIGVPLVSVLATLALFEGLLRVTALSKHFIK